MKISSWPVCCVVFAASGLLVAQQGTLSGPVAGYVFDSAARAVRPIQGIPGASLMGDPVAFGFDLAAAYISPAQNSALVVGADASLHFFKLSGGAAAEVGLGGLSGLSQAVVFSPSGSSAVLFAMGHARILTGLPNAPVLAGTVNIPESGAGAHPSRLALAVSDDGTSLLAISAGSVRLLGIHGDNRVLVPAHSDTLVAFAPGGHDAAVADSIAGVTLVRDASGNGVPTLLAAPDKGLAGLAGLAFSRDLQTLYVASSTAQSVAAFNLAAGSRSAISCDCTPSTLVPMGNAFRLNDFSPSPLWILDAAASTPRTVFVPARAE